MDLSYVTPAHSRTRTDYIGQAFLTAKALRYKEILKDKSFLVTRKFLGCSVTRLGEDWLATR